MSQLLCNFLLWALQLIKELGVLEYWFKPNTPSLHFSNTPVSMFFTFRHFLFFVFSNFRAFVVGFSFRFALPTLGTLAHFRHFFT